ELYELAIFIEQIYVYYNMLICNDDIDGYTSLDNIAHFYSQLNDYDNAIKYEKLCYENRKKTLGSEHPDTLASLDNLIYYYDCSNDYKNALNYELERYENQLYIDDEEKIQSLNNISLYFDKLGDYQKALEYGLKCYEIIKSSKEIDESLIVPVLSNLANYYSNIGDYNKAIMYGIECYVRHQKADDQDTFVYTSNLAMYYANLGKYNEAIKYGLESYEGQKKILGENHPDTLTTLNNLAIYYTSISDYHQALIYCEKSYHKQIELYGENQQAMTILNNLAMIYYYLGDYQKALQSAKKAYQKQKELLTENHPDTLKTLGNLVTIYLSLGDLDNALKYGQEAYEQNKLVLGLHHPNVLTCLNNLTIIYYAMGDNSHTLTYGKEYYEEAKTILGENRPETIMFLTNLAIYYSASDCEKALQYGWEAYEKATTVFNENHMIVLETISNISTIYYHAHALNKAIHYGKEAYQKSQNNLGASHPFTLNILASLIRYYSDAKQSVKKFEYCRIYLLEFMKSLNNIDAIEDKKVLREYLNNEKYVYHEFVKLLFHQAMKPCIIEEDYDLLIQYKNILFDIEYMKQNKETFSIKQITVAAIQQILPDNFMIFDYYQCDNQYGVMFLTKNYLRTLQIPSIKGNEEILQLLYGKNNYFKHIYVCPDGELYHVSFEKILPQYNISYLSSVKSLLYQNNNEGKECVSIVCPDFNINSDTFDDDNLKGNKRNNLFGGFIEEKYLKNKYMNLKIYERYQANYDNFLSIKNPKILHISTHGGYLDNLVTDNPMLKGVLYLSGFNNISQGEVIDHQYGEGYVSANDIQFMDLSGTDLVVLSACSTAKGTTIDNEGIYGLRRAFELAGAKSLLITLDEVDDDNAAIFVKVYFRYYDGLHPYQALKDTKNYLISY
ncbi:MAG: CHAT domain-containing protein, partial [Erysipelotrichaceae bacterium]|nr:CHAT domain-containing protein [Erysipelotrichaceae bacterium]